MQIIQFDLDIMLDSYAVTSIKLEYTCNNEYGLE